MQRLKPKTLLIVEDNVEVRQAIAEVLALSGWRVLEASNGIHGLRLFKNHLPDVVLTDVVMGGLDGFQLTAGIKSISPQAVVIIMTAFNAPDLREKARDAGAREFLRKPFEPRELFAALARSLGNSINEQES